MSTESRLAQLERSNRRLTAAVVVLTACIVVGHVGGAMRRPGIVQATEFELVDDRGLEQGNWTMSDNNNPFLAMRNANGEVRLIVSATSEMGGIHFFDRHGEHSGSVFGDDVGMDVPPAARANVEQVASSDPRRDGKNDYSTML